MTIEQQEQQQKSELLPKEGAALGTTGMTLGEQLRPQSPELTPKEAEALRVWLAGLAHEDRCDAANYLVNAWISEPDIPVRDIVLTGLAQFVVSVLCTAFPSYASSMCFGLRVAEDVLAGEAPGLADIQEALDRRRKGGNGEQPDE